MEFACQKFQLEVESENAMRKKQEESKRARSLSNSGGESNEESGDSDFLDDSSMYEKKMHILQIVHIILWKTINESRLELQGGTLVGADALRFILQAQKNFTLMATSYLIDNPAVKNLPGTSSFHTALVTYVNRIIIADSQYFVQEILAPIHNNPQQTFSLFIPAWTKKMELTTSRESLRINVVAIYVLLPNFSQDLVAKHFTEIGRLTFH